MWFPTSKDSRLANIHFHTHEPDLSDVPIPKYDWATLVYRKPKDLVPHDATETIGRPVLTLSRVETNIIENMNYHWPE